MTHNVKQILIMLSHEKYEKNVNINDKYNIKSIEIKSSITYHGDPNLFNKKPPENYDGNNHIPPLAAAVIGLQNTSSPLPQHLDYVNLWTDIDAQERYLNSKPPCYLILGKPGLGSYTLGENISKKINCVHLSSRNIIIEEIEQQSVTGRCLDFNMRHNKVCKFDLILSIMHTKMQSSVIKHRGYIVSGLPLVTSSTSKKYFLYNFYTEESLLIVDDLLYELIWNLKRKKPKPKVQKASSQSSTSSAGDKAAEEEIEEEEQQPEVEEEEAEEQTVQLPKYMLNLCSGIVSYHNVCLTTKKAVLLKQVQKLFAFNPYIIIHIMSPDIDVVTKKSHKYFNYLNNMNTINPFALKSEVEIRWPCKYTMMDYSKHYDSHIFNPKYSCKQPINFQRNSKNQICNYKNCVNHFLEQKLKDFDPKYIFKVDGRTSIHQMVYYIMGKLLPLSIAPILIPKPLYLEEPPEDSDDFWNIIKQLNTIKSGVLNINRYASLWNTRCPVELQKRKSVQGKYKYAVSLFKHVYVLSSLDAMISFCKNPRPYLKLEYLEPTCRMIVLGTKSSGKTMISKCLSWLFDAPYICYHTFLKDEKQKKYDSFSRSILSEIIATIEDARFMKWQTAEMERTSNLNRWFIDNLSILKDYTYLFEKKMRSMSKEEFILEEEDSMSEAELEKMDILKNQLSFLPILNDLELCKTTILNTNFIQYAPLELTNETLRPKLPILGDKDVTEAISAYILANDLQNDILPTTEEVMNEMSQSLLANDKESLDHNHTYSKFVIDDFPSDPEYWGYLDMFKLLPDYTIVLIENKEVDIEVLKTYIGIDESFKLYSERFILSTDPLVKTKHRVKKPLHTADLDIQIIIHDMINNVFDLIFLEQDNENNYTEKLTSFTEAIDKFREEWDSVKLKLEESSKAVIVVEIENKSDIQIIDEVLLKIRQSYCLTCIPLESTEIEEKDNDYNVVPDMLTYNESYYLGDTNACCPIAYYDYGVIWEGKSEFCTQFDNKSYFCSNEQCLDIFQKDVTKYLTLNEPFKNMPPLRICVIGSIGSGKTVLCKQISKELGLMHIDFVEFINYYLIPRHFKKIGRQHENSFKDPPLDDEAVMEFQVDEENDNIISDIIGNENEIRRIMINYFEKGVPLLSPLIQRLITLLWRAESFSRVGFVLDGFPKLPNDVEEMIASFCIPDLIIDVQGSLEKTLERLSSKMLKKWKMQLIDAKNEAKIKFEKERKEWFKSVTQEVVIKLIIDEIINNIISDTSVTDMPPEMITSIQSTIIDANPSGSENVDANLFTTYNEVIRQNPAPVDESQWEKAEDVLEKINARLESIFEIDDENIQTLKEMLSEQKIKNQSVNGNKPATKVFRKVLPMLSVLRNRNESFFEQTFIISSDIAETLLTEGFYLLSKFYRMCPVFIFENSHAIINPFNMCKRMNKIFPVIHRSYIYFLCSSNNVLKFRNNPLKYICSNAIKSFSEYPLRISIIGQPKSGKSGLAAKLAQRYGLMCISRGLAIRHILENLYWSELAAKIKAKLELGECINAELIMNAVHTVTIDYRAVTNGFIFDGFPDQPAEATELLKIGLYPLIILNINCNTNTVLRNSQNEVYYQLLKQKPPYSRSFIEYRYTKWQDICIRIKEWINDDIQNLHTICGNSSKWQCLQDAILHIEDKISKVNYYICNEKTKVVPAGVMCFSNEIFEERMSPLKNLCPICLHENILRHNGFPVDKKGLVQFRNRLYWLCPDHMDLGLSNPNVYLRGNINVPEIPTAVKMVSPNLLYEDGICIVTYAESLPAQKIIRGDRKFAATYGGKQYLFCTLQCLKKFLAKPHNYYDICVFKEANIFPKLSLESLPNVGYLEQTLGNILTRACCYVHVTRPKYPGLDIEISGLLLIALYLKVNNPLTPKPDLPMYEKAYRVYEARCKLINDIGLRLRSMDNPFAMYPISCSPRKVRPEVIEESSIVSMSKSVSICSTFNIFD